MTATARSGEIVPLWQYRARQKLDRDYADCLDRCHQYRYGRALFEFYDTVDRLAGEYQAYLGLIDRYYLMVSILNRIDMLTHAEKGNRWLYERCREVEQDPYGYLDLWARDHYKSSIITQAGSIQLLLRDPEMTIGIFSHTKKIAKSFLRQITQELETNDRLKRLYPSVLWWSPEKEAPRWSLDEGIVVKRRSNPPEGTMEAWGLVDGQPTGKHFRHRVYDDVWTRENVTTPEQIKKTIEARELSDNLGTRYGTEWNIGTRYSYADGYGQMLDDEVLKPRVYAATDNGTLKGKPVFLTDVEWQRKRKKQPSQVAAQFLQNPLAGQEQMFQAAWLKPYYLRPRTLNVYILADPSKGTPSRRTDNTAMIVIGVDAHLNKYLLDGVRHRIGLPSRWKWLKALYRKWLKAEGVCTVSVGYEQYGMVSDIEHFNQMMEIEKATFAIEELNWTRDHSESKTDRIERLVPDVKDSRFFLPAVVWRNNQLCTWGEDEGRIKYRPLAGDPREWTEAKGRQSGRFIVPPIKRIDEERRLYDLTAVLIEEVLYAPFGKRDDAIDATSRVYDMEPVAPRVFDAKDLEEPTYVDS